MNNKETCSECIYCLKLLLHRRSIEPVNTHSNTISALEIQKSKTKFEESFCCAYMYLQDYTNPIIETRLDDKCENFKPKYIEHIDRSSMLESIMITERLEPSDKFKKIAAELRTKEFLNRAYENLKNEEG